MTTKSLSKAERIALPIETHPLRKGQNISYCNIVFSAENAEVRAKAMQAANPGSRISRYERKGFISFSVIGG